MKNINKKEVLVIIVLRIGLLGLLQAMFFWFTKQLDASTTYPP